MARIDVEVNLPRPIEPFGGLPPTVPLLAPSIEPGSMLRYGQALEADRKATREAGMADVSRGATTAGADAAAAATVTGAAENTAVATASRTRSLAAIPRGIARAARGVAASGPAAPAAAAVAIGGAAAVVVAASAWGIRSADIWDALGDALRSPAALLALARGGMFADIDLSVPSSTSRDDAAGFGQRLGREMGRGG